MSTTVARRLEDYPAVEEIVAVPSSRLQAESMCEFRLCNCEAFRHGLPPRHSRELLFKPPAPRLGALVQEFAGQFLQGYGGVLAHLGILVEQDC